ncbi:flavo protein [Polychaeton citri CBS 116435]|uniref:Flavo protein n=1 Tax=Polychaeton citri CBS 116435 TaxID=1314669 RepID=A0A9P4Q6V3_9PEZI|nr:flavo protein [Polychaeton citri CBS 116435]
MASSSRPYTFANPRSSRVSIPSLEHAGRQPHILFASVGCTDSRIVNDLLAQIADLPDISVHAILDKNFSPSDHHIVSAASCVTQTNTTKDSSVGGALQIEAEAFELCEWADLLVLAPVDANNLAKMLHGNTDSLLLEVLRSWNVSKKILMMAGMSTLMWENPVTKKQLAKIRRKWNWIQVLQQPLLWTFQDGQRKVDRWDALDEALEAVRNQVDIMSIGHDMDVSSAVRSNYPSAGTETNPTIRLPPELWTMIIDFTGDWELAQSLRIYTNLAPPPEWSSHASSQGPRNYMEALELTILRGNLSEFKHFVATLSVPRWLSKMCIKLIMRFAMTDLLAHLEANHKDLFWTTFGHTFLPDKASSVFGRTEILDFWRTSPSFLTKEYNAEALDGASRAGFVNVLEWWQHSGLPLKFTEAALEQASSKGHMAVLEWWKAQSTTSSSSNLEDPSASSDSSKVRLKPGKAIVFATQSGHTDVVRWWVNSNIPFSHEDTVAKLASKDGFVDILQLWHDLKGSKMIFDNQVLVGATKHGHVNVLEWWKRSGLKVEYKTCDVEEALEDGDEGQRGTEVRKWWARNGLNLGVGTSEWMKTKVL